MNWHAVVKRLGVLMEHNKKRVDSQNHGTDKECAMIVTDVLTVLADALKEGIAEPLAEPLAESLAQSLSNTLSALKLANITGVKSQSQFDRKLAQSTREIHKDWVAVWQLNIISDITRGSVPYIEIHNWEQRKWISGVTKGAGPPNQDLWIKLNKFCVSEGLQLKVSDAHDGVGMKSWKVLSVSLAST